MKNLITIAAVFVFLGISFTFMVGPFGVGSWKLQHSYVSQGEYLTAGYDSLTGKAMYGLNVVPQAFSNQGSNGVQFVAGGAHDAAMADTLGLMRFCGSNEFGQDGQGNTSGTPTGTMEPVTLDSLGNTIPPICQILLSGNNSYSSSYYLCNFALSTVASGGLVYASGSLQNGMAGNGTWGPIARTKFALVPMPNSDTITKIEGIYGIIALSNHDSIICWGSSFGYTPAYVHLPHGWKAYDIAGNGVAYWALADSSGTKGVFSWAPIFLFDPAYQGQGSSGTSHATPTRVDKNNFVHPMMAGGDYPRFVTCNNETTYFVTVGGSLWSIGGNAVGEAGNGKQINFATYSTPYSWNQGLNGNNQDTVYNIAPGITDWDTVYTGFSNSWSYCAVRNNGALYEGGRNKGSQIWNGQIDCDYTNGNVRASYPDFLNEVWPDSISWPGTAVSIRQTYCPYCILNPGGFPCNLCTYPTIAAPTVNSFGTYTISSSSVRCFATATATSAYYINNTIVSQVSGPTAAVIQFPYSTNTLISGLSTGTYVFQIAATDGTQRTTTSTTTVAVGASGCANCITLPVNVKFH